MGKKDKHGKKAKGKAVEAEAAELTKKERKRLEAREAELAAKLEAKTKSKKAGKKAKAEKVEAPEPEAAPTPAEVVAAADKVLADKGASEGAIASATKAKAKALENMSDAELKARVDAKKAARKAGLDPDSVDRDDEAAVAAFNAAVVEAGGPVNLITSNAERAKLAKRVAPDEVVEVETDKGREFKAGPAADETEGETFATVEDNAPKVERDHFGRPKIYNPATGKAKAYTRVTTYIDNLEDKSALEKWKLRVMLEGVALNELAVGQDGDRGDYYVGLARRAMHERDVAIKKLDKADRKGKLDTGERGLAEAKIYQAFKSTLDGIAQEALDLGGVHEKANKGTDLHALCELYDMQGMGAVNDKLKAEEITPADHADVVAYASAMMAANIKVLECEQMVVLDELGVAGTLDRLVLAKLPGAQRATRMVADIKTGRVDYGVGKIAQQVGLYSRGKGYDPADPKARRDLKASTTKGLLIHLPQGTATCTIHVVDLTLGAKGNKLSGEVRAWRNEGKKAIDLKVDLASEVVAE